MKRLIALLLMFTMAAMPAEGAVAVQANPNNLIYSGVDSTTGNAAAPYIDHATGSVVIGAPASQPLPTNTVSASAVIDTANSTTTPLAASGTVIWSSGAMGAQTIPFSLDFKGIIFSTGLTETVTGAAANVLCTYE